LRRPPIQRETTIMKPDMGRKALIACLIAMLPGCEASETQKREETAEVAKKALRDTSARLKSLKGGAVADHGDAMPSSNAPAPE